MRTFTAKVGGTDYEIPATMGVLMRAGEVAGINILEAISQQKYGSLLQGVLFAGLETLGVTEIDGKPLTYELINDASDFYEASLNLTYFTLAMIPDVPAPKKAKGGSKNSPTEAPNSF